MSFFQSYFGYKRSPFKCEVTLKELNVLKSGNEGWKSNWFGNDTDRLVGWALESDKEVLRALLTTRKTFVVVRRNIHPEQGFRRPLSPISPTRPARYFPLQPAEAIA